MTNTGKINDVILWRSFKGGDENAFSVIYNTHAPALYSYGMRFIQDENEVKDILHNLFVKLWDNRTTIGQTDNIRFFMLRTLKNLIISHKNRAGRIDALHRSGEQLFVFDVTPESILIKHEETTIKTKQLMDSINQLSSRQKEIIYLKYFEEFDYTEIAEIMDISVKGAYKLSARAIDSLKTILNSPKSVTIAALLSLKYL